MSKPLIAKISLKNIVYNCRKVKKLIDKKVKFCAVIKSDAYGHGLIETAKALYNEADAFAVSLASEVYALRISGINKEILLLTPVYTDNAEKLIRYGATLSVGTLRELKTIILAAKRLKMPVKIHFAINSGMNRLGFSGESEILSAIGLIKRSRYVYLTGAFTHFYRQEDSGVCEEQFAKFLNLAKPVKAYSKGATLHAASSGGLLQNKKYALDMVRVGIMLYGYTPFKTDKITLKRAAKVYAPYVLTRNIKGAPALYGGKIYKGETANVIRLGYADGFMRGGTFDLNLCMDLAITDAPQKNGRVLIFNDAEVLADRLNTISYEILVNALRRAKKEYEK